MERFQSLEDGQRYIYRIAISTVFAGAGVDRASTIPRVAATEDSFLPALRSLGEAGVFFVANLFTNPFILFVWGSSGSDGGTE